MTLRSSIVAAALALALASAGGAQERDGFVLGSRVNVRAAPQSNAPILAALTVGMPVRYTSGGDWCRIELFDRAAGFAPCNVIAAERPTLAFVDEQLAHIEPGAPEENDWLARRFYLSPSLNTLRLVRERKHLPSGPQDDAQPPATRTATAFFAALLDAFRGDVTGADFRPVDLHANEVTVTTLQSLAPPDGKLADGAGDLPPARASLFRTPLDVLVVGPVFGGADNDGEVARHVTVAVPESAKPADVTEFAKLYAEQRFNVRQLDPLPNDYGESELGKAGGATIAFAAPPRAIVIARNRGIAASITAAELRVAQDACGAAPLAVDALLEQPLFAASGLLVALAPNIRVDAVTRVADSTNPALYDLNGDGAADLASVTYAAKSQLEDGTVDDTVVLANVAGSWRIARTIPTVECD